MGLIDTLRGPKSKYDKTLPYTYEARIALGEGIAETHSHFSDTICGLVDLLHERHIAAANVAIFEIYTDREVQIDPHLLTDESGDWLLKPEICRAFEAHYRGHIDDDGCSFSDRDRSAI